MYICVCHAISDRQIREAVDRGAESLCEVQSYLPVASCCGRCEDSAREVIESHVESTTPVAPKRPDSRIPALACCLLSAPAQDLAF